MIVFRCPVCQMRFELFLIAEQEKDVDDAYCSTAHPKPVKMERLTDDYQTSESESSSP